jgi:hypothetical protein
MPVKAIRGVDIVYEILSDSGPWVTVTPGGRRGPTRRVTRCAAHVEPNFCYLRLFSNIRVHLR